MIERQRGRERDREREKGKERVSEWVKEKEREKKVSDDLSVSLVSLYNLLFSVKQFFCNVYTYILITIINYY